MRMTVPLREGESGKKRQRKSLALANEDHAEKRKEQLMVRLGLTPVCAPRQQEVWIIYKSGST